MRAKYAVLAILVAALFARQAHAQTGVTLLPVQVSKGATPNTFKITGSGEIQLDATVKKYIGMTFTATEQKLMVTYPGFTNTPNGTPAPGKKVFWNGETKDLLPGTYTVEVRIRFINGNNVVDESAAGQKDVKVGP